MVDLFKLKNHQQMVLPVGVILIYLSMVIASNWAEHREEGLIITGYYLHIPFLMIIPLLMLVIVIIRNFFKNTVCYPWRCWISMGYYLGEIVYESS
ncbi:hypothetical protein [Neobacillus ginsengisoli]|uniref:Uncharacterized protein n=1 Tax=Neobacillus ginsengisoli TaxID=904295 RepID=A0ABT9XWT3_9BACI|nr:hypothetical protein [Neobacillus ginsengisoli]MDQ0199843.1 hypothetical protein [Neobacillus ginsengisoli]